MKTLPLILGVLLVLTLASCNNVEEEATSSLQSTTISTNVIRSEAQTIVEKAPIVKPHTDAIINQTHTIDANTSKTTTVVNKLQDDLEAERDSSNKWLHKTIVVTIFASGLAVAVTFTLFILGYIKSTIATALACSVFGAAVAMQVMMAYMVFIAIGVVLIVGGTVLWFVLKYKKNATAEVPTTATIDPNAPKTIEVPKNL